MEPLLELIRSCDAECQYQTFTFHFVSQNRFCSLKQRFRFARARASEHNKWYFPWCIDSIRLIFVYLHAVCTSLSFSKNQAAKTDLVLLQRIRQRKRTWSCCRDTIDGRKIIFSFWFLLIPTVQELKRPKMILLRSFACCFLFLKFVFRPSKILSLFLSTN